MGFLDKLKDVAKNASAQFEKAVAEKEKQALIDSLDDCASVKGKSIPEKAWLCLDSENKRIIIRTDIINNHHNLICEHSFEDVAVLKLNKCSESDFSSYTGFCSYLTVVLNTGEELELCNIIYKYGESDISDYKREREKKSKERALDIVIAFASKAQDNETIKWANDILENNGYSDLLEYFE